MNRWSYAFLLVGVSLGLLGCSDGTNAPGGGKPREPKRGIDPNDPSVVYDGPYTMVTGFKTFNGNAYDKVSLWVDPKSKLVLPDEATEVVRHGPPDVVVVHME